MSKFQQKFQSFMSNVGTKNRKGSGGDMTPVKASAAAAAPVQPTGMPFNAAKQQLFDFFSEIRVKVQDKMNLTDIPAPQFVIVGKQSVGKSRLIESLAGEPFNLVSSTLGSRRPTILEFRNTNVNGSVFYLFDRTRQQWRNVTQQELVRIVSSMHESLGENVSSEEIFIRCESRFCVDMQVVDLPGFRELALDDQRQGLADKIAKLNEHYMAQHDSVMIVVEEAGDAANMSCLQRARKFDKLMERTILVWNKLDKYYKDLSSEAINSWFEGFGSLPQNLDRFCMTLPNWPGNQQGMTAEQFVALRDASDQQDRAICQQTGASARMMNGVGFNIFSNYLQSRVFDMFVKAMTPVGAKLQLLRRDKETQIQQMQEEMGQTDGGSIVHTVRLCGVSFAQALNDVMEGYQKADMQTRFDLEGELNHFYELNPEFEISNLLPFNTVEDYVTWLGEQDVIADVTVPLNGGAQYRRLMKETMVTTLFATLERADRANVIQARGERRLSLSWDEVVVKMLAAGQDPIEARINYAAARINHFYQAQKDVIRDYMRSFAEAQDRPGFRATSAIHTQQGGGLVSGAFRLMEHNHIVRGLVLGAYDAAAERQMEIFAQTLIQLAKSLLANPWLYLQSSTTSVWDQDGDDPMNAWWHSPHRDMEFLKGIIPNKVKHRQQLAKFLNDRIKEIPSNEDEQEDAIQKVIATVQHVYDLVQTQVADQISHVAETFYKMPMMRQMEADMVQIMLPDDVDTEIKDHRSDLTSNIDGEAEVLKSINECIARHSAVKNRVLSSMPSGGQAEQEAVVAEFQAAPQNVSSGSSGNYSSDFSSGGQQAWDDTPFANQCKPATPRGNENQPPVGGPPSRMPNPGNMSNRPSQNVSSMMGAGEPNFFNKQQTPRNTTPRGMNRTPVREKSNVPNQQGDGFAPQGPPMSARNRW
eukprot:Platyproteum_vivax@DN2574_c0_g1_i1.p1